MTTFCCSACGTQLKAKEALAGRKVRCPQCQASTQVPPAGPTQAEHSPSHHSVTSPLDASQDTVELTVHDCSMPTTGNAAEFLRGMDWVFTRILFINVRKTTLPGEPKYLMAFGSLLARLCLIAGILFLYGSLSMGSAIASLRHEPLLSEAEIAKQLPDLANSLRDINRVAADEHLNLRLCSLLLGIGFLTASVLVSSFNHIHRSLWKIEGLRRNQEQTQA